MGYDFRGIGGLLRRLNEMAESGIIEGAGNNEAAANIKGNLVADLDALYISLQNDDAIAAKCSGIFDECRRYTKAFSKIDASKCTPNWYGALLYLYGSANVLLALAEGEQGGDEALGLKDGDIETSAKLDTKQVIKLFTFFSGLKYVTEEMNPLTGQDTSWAGKLNLFENKLSALCTDIGFLAGFSDYLCGDYNKQWVSNLMGQIVPVREYLESDLCKHDIEAWMDGRLIDESRSEQIKTLCNKISYHLAFLQENIENAVRPQHKRAGKGGRTKGTFKDRMIDDGDGRKLQKIHSVWGCRKGKEAALLIKACIDKGWINKPTFGEVVDEFGFIGNKSGYNKYMRESKHSKDEISGAKNSLD